MDGRDKQLLEELRWRLYQHHKRTFEWLIAQSDWVVYAIVAAYMAIGCGLILLITAPLR